MLCDDPEAPFNSHTYTIVGAVELSLVRWKILNAGETGDDVIGARVAFVGGVSKNLIRIIGGMEGELITETTTTRGIPQVYIVVTTWQGAPAVTD